MTKQDGSQGEKTTPNTLRLLRVVAMKPQKFYCAFSKPDAVARRLPPNGFTCTIHLIEAMAGGAFRMSFRNFTTWRCHTPAGHYPELVPGECLSYTDKFDDPDLPGEIRVTVRFEKVSVGTKLRIAQKGLRDAIAVEACYLGWQQSLRNHFLTCRTRGRLGLTPFCGTRNISPAARHKGSKGRAIYDQRKSHQAGNCSRPGSATKSRR